MLLVILVVLVAQLNYSTKVDAYIARNSGNDLQNRYALISAIRHGIAQLQADALKDAAAKDKKAFDALHEKWSKEYKGLISNTLIQYEITAENAKFDLWLLVKEKKKQENKEDEKKDKNKKKKNPISPEDQFDRLIELLQKEQKLVESKKLRENIKAWIKEKKGKSNLPGPFLKKESIFSMKELLFVKGMEKEILYGEGGGTAKFPGLSKYVTIWSQGKININIASKKILQSLSKKITEELADRIIEHRKKQGEDGKKQIFTQIKDLTKVEGITKELFANLEDLITVRSNYFTIKASATTDNMKKEATAVVYRSGKKIYTLLVNFED